MSDRFHPIPMHRLVDWIFSEFEERRSILGLPRELFFAPRPDDPFTVDLYGQRLATPFGVAAGPHTQMAQNIVLAWLVGSRVIELKTVQVLDDLEITKPCIDMQDEGYNIEWSQELEIDESIDEYVRAWVLIHALHRMLGHPGPDPATLFNMSVGYDLAGVKDEKVHRFITAMLNAGGLVDEHLETVITRRPDLEGLRVPRQLCNSVTLSTMHGCPPDEIGRISSYLMSEYSLHTSVKMNPTLLGPEMLRSILNDELGWRHVSVPDAAFEHDIDFAAATSLLTDLAGHASGLDLTFGVKLTNTLEVVHGGGVFDAKEGAMYLSGRPLHALSVNVADKLNRAFGGRLLMSFAGGADSCNVDHLLAAGMATITTCSDVLRPGGYSRILQYLEATRHAMNAADATTIADFVRARAGDTDLVAAASTNLTEYARAVRQESLLDESRFLRAETKTSRRLGLFDCIDAPCTDACSVDQAVPRYMRAVRDRDFERAVAITNEDNPLPAVLGRACTHPCEPVCLRTHYDEPLAIREIKRFIMAHEQQWRNRSPEHTTRVAVIGGGPCGLGAATFLGRAGYPVTVFEKHPYAGGMVEGTIPVYRTTHEIMNQDLERVRALGVEFEHGREFGRDFTLDDLQRDGFGFTVIAAGAQEGWTLGIEGEEGDGIHDGLRFLRRAKHGNPPDLGSRVVVIGGGDVAMDCARTARRLSRGEVSVLYRRTRAEMPAQHEEIEDLLTEGADLVELVTPIRVNRRGGTVFSLTVQRMQLGEADASGRRRPVPIPGATHDIGIDSMILAIGQKPTLEFLADEGIELTRSGHVVVDEQTLETNRSGVFAGGDSVSGNALSIVRACGHGRRIAATIRARVEGPSTPATADPGFDRATLLVNRAHRQWRIEVPHLDADRRQGFDEVIQTLGEDAAVAEAGRCLDCDLMCSTCETVCPNHAIFTWEATDRHLLLPRLTVQGTELAVGPTTEIGIGQRLQIGIFTDFCNECGNCVTFCPTAGQPYRDKPRFYLDESDFRAQQHNAFRLAKTHETIRITGRYDGRDHEVDVGNGVRYRSPEIELHLANDLSLVSSEIVGEPAQGAEIDLEPLAHLLLMVRSITASMPGLPVADG